MAFIHVVNIQFKAYSILLENHMCVSVLDRYTCKLNKVMNQAIYENLDHRVSCCYRCPKCN